MKEPKQYFIICNKTKEIISEQNTPPYQSLLYPKDRTFYIDTRYKAKLRLYKYVMLKKYNVKL